MTKHDSATILGGDLTRGLRQVLENGMTPEELAIRVGRIIDTIVGDLEVKRRTARVLGKHEDCFWHYWGS